MHACCADTVFAELRHCEKDVSCGQNAAKKTSISALSAAPMIPRTVPAIELAGRRLPDRRARCIAVTPSQLAQTPSSRAKITR